MDLVIVDGFIHIQDFHLLNPCIYTNTYTDYIPFIRELSIGLETGAGKRCFGWRGRTRQLHHVTSLTDTVH